MLGYVLSQRIYYELVRIHCLALFLSKIEIQTIYKEHNLTVSE